MGDPMKFETITVNKVAYGELEAHIHRVYGIDVNQFGFSAVSMEEWQNNGDHRYKVKKEPLNEWKQEALDKWMANPHGDHKFILHIILQDMANNGHVPEGTLLVGVFW